jgi:predicted DNA-binding transcriptional regulator AlpA
MKRTPELTHIGEIIGPIVAPLLAEMRQQAKRYAEDDAQVNGERVVTRWADALEAAMGVKGSGPAGPQPPALFSVPTTWRERLWVVPDETRLGVRELAEALGRPRSWVYRHTSKRSGLQLLPHRKLDGDVVFVAAEIRAWVASHEDVVVKPMSAVITFKRGA